MKIIFFGTPGYVLPVAEKIHKAFKTAAGISPIMAVVTQEPKPAGRSQELKYSAIDTWAHKKGIPIHFNPMDVVRNYPSPELGILASYGRIVPQEVIEHFKHGILNIHPSLLPYWRGASPVQASIIEGGPVGATIMKLDKELDHGPIVDQFEDQLLDDDNTNSLRDRLFDRSADVMVGLIPAYIEGKINLEEQVHEEATYSAQIKKDDAYIDPNALGEVLQGNSPKDEWIIPFMKNYTTKFTPTTIHNFVRAMQPWPQAWTTVKLDPNSKQTKRLKILKSNLEEENKQGSVGKKEVSKNEPQTKKRLVIDEVQLEGKTPVSWEQFKEGYNNFGWSD